MKDGSDQDERAAGGDGPRAKPGLADRVYHLLYSRISNGDYPANQKLPSEKTLADEFGVSRPVLRMALERLRDQGLIHSRQGAGSYVREVKTVPLGFARVETIADIQRCYEFRICIETMAARLAAARRGREALDEIATALSLMEGATELADPPRGRGFLLSPRGREGRQQPVFRGVDAGAARAHLRRHEAARPVADDRRSQGAARGLRRAFRRSSRRSATATARRPSG